MSERGPHGRDSSPGPGWWLASDGKWYSPEQAPGTAPTQTMPVVEPQPASSSPPSTAPATNEIAKRALVVGVVAVVTGFIPALHALAWVLGALALILGYVGRTRAQRGMDRQQMATIGAVLGAAAIVLGLFGLAADDNGSTKTNTNPSAGVTAGGLKVTLVRCRADPDGSLRANGAVTNTTGSTKDVRTVQVTFRTADGDVVGTGTSPIGPFFPHDSQTYDVFVPFSRAKGTDVKCTAGLQL